MSKRGVASHLARVLLVSVTALIVAAPSALASGDANELACPNEAMPDFRVYLPDCRAYEQVSPQFKEGYQTITGSIAPEGSAMILESLGTFAGVEGNSSTAISPAQYESERTGNGWAVAAATLPASVFRVSAHVGTSSDLNRTLWETHTSSQAFEAVDLYVRSADGAFVEIGPMAPPSAEIGSPTGASGATDISHHSSVDASQDLSHVLFAISGEAKRWPGDTTVPEGGASSLYEYSGTDKSQPSLVGVDAEGRLISDCRTVLGEESRGGTDLYNAMSASGETVFFTAIGHLPEGQNCDESTHAPAVNELYASIGERKTVAISEPSAAQCAECETAIKAPAAFQGASEDGTKAFFLTEQELLPGAGTTNLYEYDFDAPEGHKIVRISIGSATPEVQGVARVSEDGSHVYFVAKGILTSEPDHSLAPGHQLAEAGADNLYLFERDATYPTGHIAFVATLAEADERDWSNVDARPVQTTPEGRFLVFDSVADLTPGDTSDETQVFEYDAVEGTLARISTGQAGYPAGEANAAAHASTIPVQDYEVGEPTTANTALAISDDGSIVLFTSSGALVPQAEPAEAAGAESVYEYRSAGSIANGSAYLISDGRDTESAVAVGLDGSGADVFFETAQPLLAQDGDTEYDVYDARADGGFPTPSSPPACEGEGCRGGPSTPPSLAVPGSVSLVNAGNLQPPAAVASPARPKPRASALQRALVRCRRLRHRARAKCKAAAKRRYTHVRSRKGDRS